MDRRLGAGIAVALLLIGLTGCAGAPVRGATTAPGPSTLGGEVERLRVEVLAVHPHDPTAFTQGLLWHAGYLYESTGLAGASSLREVEPASGQVMRLVHLEPHIFGEGLARVADRLIQITWQNRLAFVYDLTTFERRGEFTYTGEGWGLCYDGERLVMSDGSSRLTLRHPETFEVLGEVRVTLAGQPVDRLNELECVGEDVYANVWFSDDILRIDRPTGRVTAVVDASGLLPPDERPRSVDAVLNGIAHDPATGRFYLTGKLWPRLFEVRFVPAG